MAEDEPLVGGRVLGQGGVGAAAAGASSVLLEEGGPVHLAVGVQREGVHDRTVEGTACSGSQARTAASSSSAAGVAPGAGRT